MITGPHLVRTRLDLGVVQPVRQDVEVVGEQVAVDVQRDRRGCCVGEHLLAGEPLPAGAVVVDALLRVDQVFALTRSPQTARDMPTAAANTILLRMDTPAALVRRRAQDRSCSRSFSESTNCAGFGPRSAMPHARNRSRTNDSGH